MDESKVAGQCIAGQATAFNLRLVSPEDTEPHRTFLVRTTTLAIRSTESAGARYY